MNSDYLIQHKNNFRNKKYMKFKQKNKKIIANLNIEKVNNLYKNLLNILNNERIERLKSNDDEEETDSSNSSENSEVDEKEE